METLHKTSMSQNSKGLVGNAAMYVYCTVVFLHEFTYLPVPPSEQSVAIGKHFSIQAETINTS